MTGGGELGEGTATASGAFTKYDVFSFGSKCNGVYLQECAFTPADEYKDCQQKCLARLDCGGFFVATGSKCANKYRCVLGYSAVSKPLSCDEAMILGKFHHRSTPLILKSRIFQARVWLWSTSVQSVQPKWKVNKRRKPGWFTEPAQHSCFPWMKQPTKCTCAKTMTQVIINRTQREGKSHQPHPYREMRWMARS